MSKMIAEHGFAIGGCDASQPQQPGSGYELVSQIAKSPDNKVVWAFLKMAEEVGFEPTDGRPSPVFKTGAFSRSATPPNGVHTTSSPCSYAIHICSGIVGGNRLGWRLKSALVIPTLSAYNAITKRNVPPQPGNQEDTQDGYPFYLYRHPECRA